MASTIRFLPVCSRRWSLTIATMPITAMITAGSPMLVLGMSPSKDTTNEFTRPVKAVIASASPPGTAFGPKIVRLGPKQPQTTGR